jgi:hypothetical protein
MAIVSVIGAEEEVEAMGHVPSRLAELVGCALSESQEIVDKDVDVSQGSSRRARDWPRDVWCGGGWTGELLQRVGGSKFGESPGVVDEVGHRFGGSTEEWSRFYKAHQQGEVKADDGIWVARMRWHNEGKFGKVG